MYDQTMNAKFKAVPASNTALGLGRIGALIEALDAFGKKVATINWFEDVRPLPVVSADGETYQVTNSALADAQIVVLFTEGHESSPAGDYLGDLAANLEQARTLYPELESIIFI